MQHDFMRRALELAAQGRGFVEPNPMVGCVIVRDGQILSEGWHQKYGGPHAEIEALNAAKAPIQGADMYVTLEPCCHHGKTPPCTDAIIAAGIRRVIIGMADPFPSVSGKGMQQLLDAGIEVFTGVLEEESRELNAPYLKLIEAGRPWVIAKWAMSLDGKIATRSGDSRWISNEASRKFVHELRGRVDAILVGRRTVEQDDPLLTARPPGPRKPTRIVLDSNASLPLTSQLVKTLDQAPVLVVASLDSSTNNQQRLRSAGCEVFLAAGGSWPKRLELLLQELGRRRLTNILVEGGSQTLGGFFDTGLVDEIHVFVAPKVIGGDAAPSPIAGTGVNRIAAEALKLRTVQFDSMDGDLHVWGRR